MQGWLRQYCGWPRAPVPRRRSPEWRRKSTSATSCRPSASRLSSLRCRADRDEVRVHRRTDPAGARVRRLAGRISSDACSRTRSGTRSSGSCAASIASRSRTRCLRRCLFTDIVGSTEKAAELGDRALGRARVAPPRARPAASGHVRRHRDRHGRRRVLRELRRANRGRSAARRAISECVRSLGLEVRARVHTGECERIDGKIGGLAVNIGARVASSAEARRGPRLEHGQGPRRRVGDRVRRPRRARVEGRSGGMASVRCSGCMKP